MGFSFRTQPVSVHLGHVRKFAQAARFWIGNSSQIKENRRAPQGGQNDGECRALNAGNAAQDREDAAMTAPLWPAETMAPARPSSPEERFEMLELGLMHRHRGLHPSRLVFRILISTDRKSERSSLASVVSKDTRICRPGSSVQCRIRGLH